MEFKIEVISLNEDRESLKEFKKYICNKYRVKNVDDTPLSIKEYAEFITIYEAGWQAREQKWIDELFTKNNDEVKISFNHRELDLLKFLIMQYNYSDKPEYQKIYSKLIERG